jgi:poly(3-hydroxybutyrate) depolymerase
VLEFFQTSTRNILAQKWPPASATTWALSVVGTDRLPDSGYFRAKPAQPVMDHYQLDPDRIAIAGDSVGGNMTAALARSPPATPASGPATSSGQWPRRAEPTGRTPPGR